jgi:hypothetical protein
MCHGYWDQWQRRESARREEPITFVSDPEVKEPVEPVAEEPAGFEPEPEKVPAGVAD